MRRRTGSPAAVLPEDFPDWVVEVPGRGGYDPRRLLDEAEQAPAGWYEEIQEATRRRREWLAEHAPGVRFGEIQAERLRRWPVVDPVSRGAR